MRKATDDVMARSAAESRLSDQLEQLNAATDDAADQMARDLIGTFKAVEFETKTVKSQGEEIHLRRLVITGEWEVDPGKH
jgi:hypothetical protein